MLSRPHLLIAAGLLSLCTGALAQTLEQPKGGPGSRGRHDAAMPATMKRTDLKAMLETRFDKLDANHDGKLTPEDREIARVERRDATFAKLDANQDGSISKTEFETARKNSPNGPQAVDGKSSMRAVHANWRPHPMRAMMFDGSKDPISKADFVATGLARFDKVDTNHDGTISSAEREASRKDMPRHREHKNMPSPPAPPRG